MLSLSQTIYWQYRWKIIIVDLKWGSEIVNYRINSLLLKSCKYWASHLHFCITICYILFCVCHILLAARTAAPRLLPPISASSCKPPATLHSLAYNLATPPLPQTLSGRQNHALTMYAISMMWVVVYIKHVSWYVINDISPILNIIHFSIKP